MELRDDEILLRPTAAADAEAIAAGLDDPDCARFMVMIPSPYTRADADAWVERCMAVWQTGESYPFTIVDQQTGDFLGAIELSPEDTIGYWITRDARGRGIATRALTLVCEWAKQRPLRLTHLDNVASQRVAEKAGFTRVGITTEHPPFKDETREAAVFQLD